MITIMGPRVSKLFSKSGDSLQKSPSKEKELALIQNHPNRARRLSSVAPSTPAIKEEKILEDLCDSTNIEPDVPANIMGKREVHKLIKRISNSEEFANTFPTEEHFLEHVRKLSDGSPVPSLFAKTHTGR